MYVIAEIGVNHDGSIEKAKELVGLAKNSGADAVKFQSFSANRLATEKTKKVEYQLRSRGEEESHLAMLKRLEFDIDTMLKVKEYCNSLEIDFLSTPYDIVAANELIDIGVEIFKTASADIVDLALHSYLSKNAKKVIISCGMATLGEIEDCLTCYDSSSTEIILLHCVSNYPASPESINLEAIKTLQNAFGLAVGFSDHTIGYTAAAMSVVYGVELLEKHFTYDKKADGPDHYASSEPDELRELIIQCKIAERMLGSSVKKIQQEEFNMRNTSRKSLHFAMSLRKGEIINESHLKLIRPNTGIAISEIQNIIGMKITSDAKMNEPVTYEQFK